MLQAYFRGGDFEYSLDAPERASGDAISDFLADKQGYCVQFSSAMTIMARTMGIPARIGVGYAGGDEAENGVDVSMQDSHAWPELYFEGAGWVRFEPTPGGPAGDPPKWTLADGADQQEEGDESESASPSEEPTESASPTGDSEEPSEEETSTQAAEPAGSNFGTVFGIVAIVLVLLLLAALPAIWRSILRSRRTKDPQNLEAVWTEVRALATDYGQSLDSSRTLRFNELVLAGAVPAAGAAGAAGGGGTEAADASSPTDAEAGSTAPEIDADTGEPIRKSAAEAAAGSGAAGENAAGSSTFDRSDERLRRLSSPAPSRPSESGHDDSALGAFVDALEAQRYGAAPESLDDSEVSALVDELRTDLSERATPGSRISARIWPASLFNRPK